MSKQYLLTERQKGEVDSLEYQQKVLTELNKVCSIYSLYLPKKGNEFFLVETDQDLVEIGKGGFADIFSTKIYRISIKKIK